MFGGNNKIMRCSTFFRVLIKMFTRLRKRMQGHCTQYRLNMSMGADDKVK